MNWELKRDGGERYGAPLGPTQGRRRALLQGTETVTTLGEGVAQKHVFLRNEPDWFSSKFKRMWQEGKDL
jgi:hypothetical protein